MRTVTNNEALHVFVMVPAELASLLSEFVCVFNPYMPLHCELAFQGCILWTSSVRFQ